MEPKRVREGWSERTDPMPSGARPLLNPKDWPYSQLAALPV